jgi:hypothetical protein
MLYAIFCYASEAALAELSPAQDEAMMATIGVAKRELQAKGKLGPAVRLMPTTTATTLRHGGQELVLDGPFAETKEQLLGFYLLECDGLDDAVEAARALSRGRTPGSLEIRPVASFQSYGELASRSS